MLRLRILTVVSLVWAIQAETLIRHLNQYKRNQQLDGKKCKNADIVFEHYSLPLPRCAGYCQHIAECAGFMYNAVTTTCVGCKGEYTNQTALNPDPDTRYFEGDWWVFNGHFYKRFNKKRTFSEAVASCESYGGFLARIDTAEKSQFMVEVHVDRPGNFWVGLTDEGHEGQWTWINDNSVTNYTNWNTGGFQPNGDGNCVRTNRFTGYLWGDVSCDSKISIMCERNV